MPIRSPSAVPPRLQTSLPNQSAKTTSHVEKNESWVRDWIHGIDELGPLREVGSSPDRCESPLRATLPTLISLRWVWKSKFFGTKSKSPWKEFQIRRNEIQI